MTRWFIKEVATATETNPNFAGKVEVDICGKNEESIFSDDLYRHKDLTNNHICIAEYGYKSKSRAITEATKQAREIRDSEKKYGFWTYRFYVVGYSVDGNSVTPIEELEVAI